MRRLTLGLLLVAGLAACGGRERTPALPAVRLVLTAPGDASSVESPTVMESGTVAPPDARVLIQGREAEVRGGRFSAEVELAGGANVIDVQAAAPRRPAAMTAVRVTRLVPVRVPNVERFPPGDAVDALEAVGLRADVRDGGILDDILPGTPGVCETEPPRGERVPVGTTVTVVVRKSC